MPELPEVEFARISLNRWLKGAVIEKVVIEDARILDDGIASIEVIRALSGRTVREVARRGKWLRVELDQGLVFSHLGMTGKWLSADPLDAPLRFEKVRLDVLRKKKHRSVRYIDPRLFGRFTLSETDLAVWSALGPDPLHDGIDADVLHEKLARRKLAIKPTLLDQTVLAGVGNIQATEALYFARIDPRRPSNRLTRRETGALARGILRTIRETLALQTGPTLTYVEEPGAENPFTIYGRGGDPCPRCGTELSKIMLGGRGTVFCAICQK